MLHVMKGNNNVSPKISALVHIKFHVKSNIVPETLEEVFDGRRYEIIHSKVIYWRMNPHLSCTADISVVCAIQVIFFAQKKSFSKLGGDVSKLRNLYEAVKDKTIECTENA